MNLNMDWFNRYAPVVLRGMAIAFIIIAFYKAPSIRAVVPAAIACACALTAMAFRKGNDQ